MHSLLMSIEMGISCGEMVGRVIAEGYCGDTVNDVVGGMLSSSFGGGMLSSSTSLLTKVILLLSWWKYSISWVGMLSVQGWSVVGESASRHSVGNHCASGLKSSGMMGVIVGVVVGRRRSSR